MDRYVKLIEAMAGELDTIPWLEAVVLSETAIDGKQNMSGYTNDGYGAELKKLVEASGAAFEQTVIILYGNWLPAGYNLILAQDCFDNGVGWGGPDSPNDSSWFTSENSGYIVAKEYTGRIPLGYAVQSSGYCGSLGCWPVEEMFGWANTHLNVNYRFWLRNNTGAPGFDADVFSYVNQREGAITTACPENIGCAGSTQASSQKASVNPAGKTGFRKRVFLCMPGSHTPVREGKAVYGMDGRRLSNVEITSLRGVGVYKEEVDKPQMFTVTGQNKTP